jgi:hypothetical protein
MDRNINTNISKRRQYYFTKDEVFAVKSSPTGSNSLYVKNGHNIDTNSPLYDLIQKGKIIKNTPIPITQKNGVEEVYYDEYMFYRKLIDKREYDSDNKIKDSSDSRINENDCLKFAETLSLITNLSKDLLHDDLTDKFLKNGENPSVLQTCYKTKTFGDADSEEENIKKIMLNKIPPAKINDNAVPQVGESYAIVRKKIISGSPYHIAFVIYNHEEVNITLEAAADQGSEYYPQFCFYDTNPNGKTFHYTFSGEKYEEESKKTNNYNSDLYKEYYTNGTTIVLKPRMMDDVLKEIKEEFDSNKEIEQEKVFNKRKSTYMDMNTYDNNTYDNNTYDNNTYNKTTKRIRPDSTYEYADTYRANRNKRETNIGGKKTNKKGRINKTTKNKVKRKQIKNKKSKKNRK